jgi:hypothetical protein
MEEENNQLGDLTLSAILTDALGGEKARLILSDIQDAIDKEQLRGEELKRRIYELLCKYAINDLEVYHILLRAPQVIPHVIPK